MNNSLFNKYIFLFIFVIAGLACQAQTSKVGIFETEQQFVTNKPSKIFDVDNDWLPLNLNVHSDLVIHSIQGDFTFTFGKLYGYSVKNDRYKAYGKKGALNFYGYYKIIDTAGIIVYSRNVRHGKSAPAPSYYFSKSLTAPVRELTIHELKKAYPENKRFIERVKPVFRAYYPALFEKDKDGRAQLNQLYLESKQAVL